MFKGEMCPGLMVRGRGRIGNRGGLRPDIDDRAKEKAQDHVAIESGSVVGRLHLLSVLLDLAVYWLGLDGIVSPRLSHLARQPGIGFGIIDELFCFRVPLELAPETHGDHAEMTHTGGAVADTGFADGRLAGSDAIDQVPSMVIADVKPFGT